MPALDLMLVQYCANDPGDCQDIHDALNNGTIFDYCVQHTDSPFCETLFASNKGLCNPSLLDTDNYNNCLKYADNVSGYNLTACQAQADLDTANLDNLVQQLATGWNPTGFYTSHLIIELVGRWNERSQASRAAIANAQGAAQQSNMTSLLKDRLDSLDTFDAQAQKYLQAAQDAGADGIVQADKLKDWATGGLRAASDALHAAEVVTCKHDLDWNPLVALGQFLWTVGGEAKQVIDAAYQAGKNVVKASEWLLGALGWIVTHGWTVFGIAAGMFALGLAVKHRDSIKNTFTKFKSPKPALSGYHRKRS